MNVENEIVSLYPWIVGVACRLSPHDGEDLAHDTVVKALLGAARFDVSRDMKPWLMAIMVNTLRSLERRRQCVDFCPLADGVAVCVHDDPFDAASVRSLVSLIGKLARRDVAMRSLWLYAMGYDYGEIAAITRSRQGTVKSRIHYARKRLKVLLEA